MNTEYAKLGKALLISVLLFIVLDFIIGTFGDWLRNYIPATVSQIGKSNASETRIKADVLIIGSSRAAHHYNSKIMQEALGMSVYNAGSDGMGLMYGSCILNSTLKRCKPKIVILELSDAILVGDYKTSVPLNVFYNDDAYIKKTINSVDGKTMNVKMMVNMFRFNKLFAKFAEAFISPLDDKSGYEPLPPNNSILKPEIKPYCISRSDIDTLALSRLYDVMKWSRDYGFRLIIVDSPTLLINQYNYSELKKICKKEKIVCIDNSNVDSFLNNTGFFIDPVHLNQIGADVYTNYFIKQIKNIIKEPTQISGF